MAMDRNYFDYHKITPQEKKESDVVINKMVALNIFNRGKNDRGEETLPFTESFNTFKETWFEIHFPEVDMLTGKEKKPTTKKEMKFQHMKKKTLEKVRKDWKKIPSIAGDFDSAFNITFIAEMILHYGLINEITKMVDETRIREGRPPDNEPLPIPMDRIGELADKKFSIMTGEEYKDLMDMARVIHGLGLMRHESEIDRMLSSRMVKLNIMTDTGHLTSTFRDCIQHFIEAEYHKPIEELVKVDDMIYSLIVEYTRTEDYENMNDYLHKKTEYEIEEYNEMTRIVGKCLSIEIARSKEGIE